MFTDANANLIRRYIEMVWNEGNLDYLQEVWGADRVAERRANWESNRRFCPDGRFSIDDLITQENKVVVRWTLAGTRPNGWRMTQHGASVNGRAMTITGITIWCIWDGRLVDSHYASEGPGIYE